MENGNFPLEQVAILPRNGWQPCAEYKLSSINIFSTGILSVIWVKDLMTVNKIVASITEITELVYLSAFSGSDFIRSRTGRPTNNSRAFSNVLIYDSIAGTPYIK
jgi:hypothetical protein